MKYFERLSTDERKKIVLGAVAFSSAMEGMSESRDRCLEGIRALERQETERVFTAEDDQEAQRDADTAPESISRE